MSTSSRIQSSYTLDSRLQLSYGCCALSTFFLANFHFKLPVRYTGNKIIALDVKLGKKDPTAGEEEKAKLIWKNDSLFVQCKLRERRTPDRRKNDANGERMTEKIITLSAG